MKILPLSNTFFHCIASTSQFRFDITSLSLRILPTLTLYEALTQPIDGLSCDVCLLNSNPDLKCHDIKDAPCST